MPFAPGQSGNPSGRPKVNAEAQALARLHTRDAITALASIAKDKDQPAAARVTASTALLDRAWGRPAQAMEVTGAGGGPVIVVTGVPRAED